MVNKPDNPQKKVSWLLRLPVIILGAWVLLFFICGFLGYDYGGLFFLWLFASYFVLPILGIWSLIAGIILFKRKQSLGWAIVNILIAILSIILVIIVISIVLSISFMVALPLL